MQYAHERGREVFRLWVRCDGRGAFWNVLYPYGLGEQDWSARASRVSVKEKADVLDVAPIVLYHVGRGDDNAEPAVPVEQLHVLSAHLRFARTRDLNRLA